MTSVADPVVSPVCLRAVDAPGQPKPSPQLEELYRGFESELLVPLWTEIGDLMPTSPRPAAAAHVWRWRNLLRLARRSGDLVPVGRGGERRAIALANPGLGGAPYAVPTLWAAIQYLNPREDAPVHRHTQHAFRFVVEGEGVWTVVDGDPVAMRRGDFLLTPDGPRAAPRATAPAWSGPTRCRAPARRTPSRWRARTGCPARPARPSACRTGCGDRGTANPG